jgi:hypothetical protein
VLASGKFVGKNNPAKLCGKENEGKENTNTNLKLLLFLSLIFLSAGEIGFANKIVLAGRAW